MYVDLACGKCESQLTLDSEGGMETMAIDLVHRFTKAHETCGFMVPNFAGVEDVYQPKRKVIKPRKVDEAE
jgi:hypothetical protein